MMNYKLRIASAVDEIGTLASQSELRMMNYELGKKSDD